MKFIIYRSSQWRLEDPIVIGSCHSFATTKDDCVCYGDKDVVAKPIAEIEMGNIRFEGDPRSFGCNDIEVPIVKDRPTRCNPNGTRNINL